MQTLPATLTSSEEKSEVSLELSEITLFIPAITVLSSCWNFTFSSYRALPVSVFSIAARISERNALILFCINSSSEVLLFLFDDVTEPIKNAPCATTHRATKHSSHGTTCFQETKQIHFSFLHRCNSCLCSCRSAKLL